MVALSVLHSLAIYALGAYLVAELGWAALLAYVALLIWVELRLLRTRCVDCHYYGKLCGLGRGALASRLFKCGQPQRFAERKPSWYNLLPDLAVALVPLLVGLTLSITRFTWPRLAALLALALVWLVGTALVRGKIACAHCADTSAVQPGVRSRLLTFLATGRVPQAPPPRLSSRATTARVPSRRRRSGGR